MSGDSKTRLDWPDVAKGICIIAVIAGHMGNSSINRMVFLWHLPVFFLLAGFFMKPVSDGAMIRSKARRLLVPYYITCLVICIIAGIKTAIGRGDTVETVKRWIWSSIYAAGDDWTRPVAVSAIGAIWFLWALFIAMVIANHFADREYGIVWIALIAFTGWLSFAYTNVWLPLSIQAGMLSSLYIVIGYQVKKHGHSFDRIPVPVLLLSLLVGAWGILNFNGFWLVHDYMGNGWDDFIVSICTSLVVMALSGLISRKTVILRKILMFFGRNSLMILCLHIIELDVLPIQSAMKKGFAGVHISQNEPQFTCIVLLLKLTYVVLGTIIINRIRNLVSKNKLHEKL